jgi:hypothetical protein
MLILTGIEAWLWCAGYRACELMLPLSSYLPCRVG